MAGSDNNMLLGASPPAAGTGLSGAPLSLRPRRYAHHDAMHRDYSPHRGGTPTIPCAWGGGGITKVKVCYNV
jgi:hypothetical protein